MLFGKHKQIVKRILIVEDEPLTAFDNETMLAEAGYEVVATVDRVADALATMDREQVDLIMADVRLSGERTGIDLARVARERGIHVLFATGAVPDEAEGLVLGCLMKPYNQKTLKAALKAVDLHLAGERAKPPKGLHLYSAT
jgi:two-component system, response regulator PdtaR